MPPKIIFIKGNDGVQKESIAAAATAIVPGDLLELATATTIREHGTADANAAPMFADLNPWVEAAALSIDEVYAVGDTVIYRMAQSGDEVYAWLAAAENVAVDAYLSSDGAGKLQAVTAAAATTEAQREGVVVRALEAVDATGTLNLRIKVEVL